MVVSTRDARDHRSMDATDLPIASRPRYIVVGAPDPDYRPRFANHRPGLLRRACDLPVGTLLEELDRYEDWYKYGPIPSIRAVMGRFRVASGPRTGANVAVILQEGYEYDPPWPFSVATWLARSTVSGR